MDSRTLVKQALTFAGPQRVPRDLWTLPWAKIHYPEQLEAIRKRFPPDMTTAPGFLHTTPPTTGDQYAPGEYIDEWGCIFKNNQPGVIGEVKRPLVENWEQWDQVRPPRESLSIDTDLINAYCRGSDRFEMAGCCPRPFERMQFIRGSENLYIDLAEQTPELFQLLDRVHQFYLEEMELWAKTGVDGIMFMDDWGAQRRLLIAPKLWRQIFKPLYKDYIDLAHRYGKFIFMHSDGYTLDILPDLIELGLDAINTQIFTMDIEELGRQFRGRLTFWGEMDRQNLLSFASTDEVDTAVRRVYDALWSNGGIIAQCEFGAGSKPENVMQVYQTWEELC